MKTCTSCNEEKDYSQFYVKKTGRDGYGSWCRSCTSDYHKQYSRRNKEKIHAYKTQWQKVNKDSHNASSEKYRLANIEKARAATADWAKRNPAASKEKVQRRRARMIGSIGFAPKGYEKIIKDICGDKCLKCGADESIQMDHVIPLSRKGLHCITNMQPLCKFCNQSKGNRHTSDYRTDEMIKCLIEQWEKWAQG